MIYQSYKPNNQEEAKEFINYILMLNPVLPNVSEILDSEDLQDSGNSKAKSYLDSLSSEHYLTKYFSQKLMHENYLVFDSNFECGNLEKVLAKSITEYDLYISSRSEERRVGKECTTRWRPRCVAY